MGFEVARWDLSEGAVAQLCVVQVGLVVTCFGAHCRPFRRDCAIGTGKRRDGPVPCSKNMIKQLANVIKLKKISNPSDMFTDTVHTWAVRVGCAHLADALEPEELVLPRWTLEGCIFALWTVASRRALYASC